MQCEKGWIFLNKIEYGENLNEPRHGKVLNEPNPRKPLRFKILE